ncbi:MAG: hypothetical protein NTZ93_04240 [Candidatus Beckwithbacteria bacterium]|nr:hypothetical protein [Candidatus Beckwithbacteria bacterium]
MKKKLIILISLILIIFMISVLSRPKTKPTTSPSFSPSPKNQFNFNGFNPQDSTQQTPDDLKYSQALTELHQQYPWYSQLPIETSEYRIIYDFDKQSFRIRLLTQPSETIKQVAIDKLKAIGVDLNKFSYYFLEK